MKKEITLLIIAAIIALFSSCSTFGGGYDMMEPEEVACYSLENEELTKDIQKDEDMITVSSEVIKLHKQIWERASTLIPDDYEHFIKHFKISSDGSEGIMAFVEPEESEEEYNLDSWTLSVDIADAMDRMGKLKNSDEYGLDQTIIHEFAHILSLNSNQAESVDISSEKPNWIKNWDFHNGYRDADIIFKKDSYLNIFFQKFWGNDFFQDFIAMNDLPDKQYAQEMNLFSIKYYNDFVSDYAMTNPDEDFAETFRIFVTTDKPDGTTKSQRKALFLYDFPELIQIREHMRSVLYKDKDRSEETATPLS